MPAGVTESPEDPGGEVLVPVFGDGSLLLVVDIDEVVTVRVIAEFLESAAARFRWEIVRMTLPGPIPANGTDCANRRTRLFLAGGGDVIGPIRSARRSIRKPTILICIVPTQQTSDGALDRFSRSRIASRFVDAPNLNTDNFEPSNRAW